MSNRGNNHNSGKSTTWNDDFWDWRDSATFHPDISSQEDRICELQLASDLFCSQYARTSGIRMSKTTKKRVRSPTTENCRCDLCKEYQIAIIPFLQKGPLASLNKGGGWVVWHHPVSDAVDRRLRASKTLSSIVLRRHFTHAWQRGRGYGSAILLIFCLLTLHQP